MTLVKGYTCISLKKSIELRLQRVRRLMEELEPEKYDETTSYSRVIDWMIDYIDNNFTKKL